MPKFLDQAETANNKDAESILQKPPQIPMNDANGFKPGGAESDADQKMGPLTPAEWLRLTLNMKVAAETNLNPLRNIWANNYRAYNNQHAQGSKYTTERYRGRSQFHRPKTRTAVKKSDAGAANALFATSDIVSVEPTNPLDPKQMASAQINKALLNFRLDRKSGKAGVPWFQIAVGAHQDSNITGLCVSKQYWERRERNTGKMKPKPVLDEQTGEPQMAPVLDALGQPTMDPATGQAVMQPVTVMQPVMKILRDRPMIRLFPPELVLRDPGADWLDQAQESSYCGLMHAMTVGDMEAMTGDPQTKTKNMRFLKVERSQLLSARIGSAGTQVTTARESSGNRGRQEVSTGLQEFDRIWAIEWFVRYQGVEYVYWTAGSTCLISEVMLLEEAYPEQGGERPIVIGVGNIEPHKIDPMSMVQSVLPMQGEMNDLVNLRMDGVKDSVRPLATVVRGKNIDVKALQHRSGDSVLYVTSKDDVNFDRPGSIGGEAYQEMNYLNADFDVAVGQFDGGSVTTNRELNKTVGGLNLLNASANVVGDFDLRVWIETYVEPVLRQVVKLEQYYEDDEKILVIAGQKANLYQKFGVSTIDDELLMMECSITVNAGIGNADPTIKFDKFVKASAAAGQLLGDQVQARAKHDPIIDELFGTMGFRDAAERFFHPGDQTDQRIVKLQEAVGALQGQVAEKQSALDNAVEVKRIESATQLAKQYLQGIQQKEAAEATAINTAKMAGIKDAHDTKKTETLGKQKGEQITAQGKVKAAQAKPNGAARPAPAPEEEADPVAEGVEDGAGLMTAMLMKSLMPFIMGQPQPQQAQPQPSPQEILPPQAPQPQGPDPMMAQVVQMMMAMMQQQNQTMQMIAQGLQNMAQAQATPKTVRKNPDGTFTAMTMPAAPTSLSMQ